MVTSGPGGAAALPRTGAAGKLTPFEDLLLRALEADAWRPKRERRTAKVELELKLPRFSGRYLSR